MYVYIYICTYVAILEPLLPGTACGRARRKMSTCVAPTPTHALDETSPLATAKGRGDDVQLT